MGRNCNLELNLLPPPSSSSSSSSVSLIALGSNGEGSQQQQQMAIFYNGRTCVCDLTELQARSIIWFASAKMEEAMNRSPISGSNPISLTLHWHLLHSPTGFSMKRSLRQFLEKRRRRIQATSPYHR